VTTFLTCSWLAIGATALLGALAFLTIRQMRTGQ
jgi:hypothetical protein